MDYTRSPLSFTKVLAAPPLFSDFENGGCFEKVGLLCQKRWQLSRFFRFGIRKGHEKGNFPN